jgi:hypothetical protein
MSTDILQKKWSPILEHADMPKITDSHKKAVIAQLLENQEVATRESQSGGYHQPTNLLNEAAPTNDMGASNGTGTGPINFVDPVLISLVRRAMPNLIAYDVAAVQPMSGPTGLIFAMKSQYASQSGDEAFHAEADSNFSGQNAAQDVPGSVVATSTATDPFAAGGYTKAGGMSTAQSEALGDVAGNQFAEMAFSIDKVSVTAKSRALKAEYTMELAQDLKAVHGLDAESELANILSTEILAEINREVIRTINWSAVLGASDTASAGTFDLDVDANGRWSVEKFKGLMFQIEREANQIAKDTRRGKGNILICSSDVASALQMAGVLDYTPALSNSLQVDDTGSTFAGVMNGRIKVYIDPYFSGTNGSQYACLGYKGSSAYDAGLFYCPYVPLQMVRAVGQDTFQPKIGFKTRYGMVANPFARSTETAPSSTDGSITNRSNTYYRIFKITNLM